MNRSTAAICSAVLTGWVLGAKAQEARIADVYDAVKGTPAVHVPAKAPGVAPVARETAEAYLRAQAALFKLPADLSNLSFSGARQSVGGVHYRYRQTLNGVPIEGAEIVVSLSRRNGQPYQVCNSTHPGAAAALSKARRLTADEALDVAWNHLKVHGKLRAAPAAELRYIPEGKGFRLAYVTLVPTAAPFGSWEHRIDASTGEIFGVRDRIIYESKARRALPDFAAYAGPVASRAELTKQLTAEQAARLAAKTSVAKVSANGTALVFDPDPRTTLKSSTLQDSTAAASFNAAYQTRPLLDITLSSGVYSLAGPWVTIAEVDDPVDAPSTSVTGNWTAKRGANAFNDAMTYFHIDQSQRYLQSLGYVGVAGVQYGSISADSDGASGEDNSYYDSGGNTLSFGHGGVDDNEDADVILHEYGHAITYDILPGWGGGDTGAIGEGFGDYWGGSYSYSTSNGPSFNPSWAFTWDGHNTNWSGRLMNLTNLTYDSAHTYVDHETISGIANYSDQLWSAPIFQAFLDLVNSGHARTNVDLVMIESFFGVTGGPTMREMAASIVLTADELFPGGGYGSAFLTRFKNQSILTGDPLPLPELLYPTGGEIFTTGATVRVQWDRRGAVSRAYALLNCSTSAPAAYSDNMESGINGWVATSSSTNQWAQTTDAYYSASHSWLAWDNDIIESQYLRSPQFTVGTSNVLSFWHWYDLEATYDGGVVELSTNGSTWVDIGTNATQNGYNATIDTGYSSPIAGRRAFSGASGSFVQTIIPLTSYAGKSVYVRFRQSNDDGGASVGWVVDDVAVGSAVTWNNVGSSATNASTYDWVLPAAPGTNYVLRMKLTGSNCTDSSWTESLPFAISPDTDHDGAPDAWEMATYGNLTTVTAVSDHDSDGASDVAEFLSGTLPGEAASVFETRAMTNSVDGTVTIQWASVANRYYSVARSTNLLTGFSVISSNIAATPPLNTFTDTNAVSPCFYEIRMP